MTIQEIWNKMDEFEESYGIPQIMGAIDGCDIELKVPPDNREDDFNRKQHYSVNLQALRLNGLFELPENKFLAVQHEI